MTNVVTAVNAIIGGLIMTLYGYFITCVATILSPLRAPLRRWRETSGTRSISLTSYSMLFLSSLLASAAISTQNYDSFVAEAARVVSRSSKFTDTSLLTILLAAIVILVLCDVVARVGTRWNSPRMRIRSLRLVGVRHYQTAATLTLASALAFFHDFAGRPLFFSYYNESRKSWFVSHQWALQLLVLMVIVLAIASSRKVRAHYKARGRRLIFKVAIPPLVCGLVLFYALGDAPRAYLLRRPQMRLSELLKTSVSESYPNVSYTRCTLTAGRQMEVSAIVTNRTKYDAAVDLSFAEAVVAQGAMPGYMDQEIGLFTRPRMLGVPSATGAPAKVALLKSGESVALGMIFDQPKQVTDGLALVRRWSMEPEQDYSDYFSNPSCFLSLRFINLETQDVSTVPDYSLDTGFWDNRGKTAPGEVVISEPAEKESSEHAEVNRRGRPR